MELEEIKRRQKQQEFLNRQIGHGEPEARDMFGIDRDSEAWFYGGKPGLQPGDPVPTVLAPLPSERMAEISPSAWIAWRDGVDLHGDLYEVEPEGARVREGRGTRDRVPEGKLYERASVKRVISRGLDQDEPLAPSMEESPYLDPRYFDSRGESKGPVLARGQAVLGFRTWQLCGAPMDGLLTQRPEGGYGRPFWQPGSNLNRSGLIAMRGVSGTRDSASRKSAGFPCGEGTYSLSSKAIWAATLGWGQVYEGTHHWRSELGEIVAVAVEPWAYHKLLGETLYEASLWPGYRVTPEEAAKWSETLAERLDARLVAVDELEEAGLRSMPPYGETHTT
jgi:hypothetical protein